MIDNFEIIKPLFYFNEGNDMFFHCQILRRGKDHPELPAANKLIQSWLVRSRDQLDKLKDEIIFLCEHYKARAYINVAGKDFDRLNALILKKLAENNYTGNVINPWHIFNSACGELTSRRKCWVVDVDSKHPDDSFETKAADQNVLTRLVARMQNEHRIQLIVDVRELRVKMPEHIVTMLYQRDIQRRKEHEQWRDCLIIYDTLYHGSNIWLV